MKLTERAAQVLAATDGDWAFAPNIARYIERVHGEVLSDQSVSQSLASLVSKGLVEKSKRLGTSFRGQRMAYRITEAGKGVLSEQARNEEA